MRVSLQDYPFVCRQIDIHLLYCNQLFADTTGQVDSMRTPTFYEIRVQGHIGGSWSSWFEGLSLRHKEDGETVLRGALADQAALHGVLMRIRDLNLPLVSVHRVDSDESCS
jgi:hypothetical protein